MKVFNAKGGIPIFLSTQEFKFIEEKFGKSEILRKKSLNENEEEIANVLVRKGALGRFKDDNNGLYFKLNTNQKAKKRNDAETSEGN